MNFFSELKWLELCGIFLLFFLLVLIIFYLIIFIINIPITLEIRLCYFIKSTEEFDIIKIKNLYKILRKITFFNLSTMIGNKKNIQEIKITIHQFLVENEGKLSDIKMMIANLKKDLG